MLRSCWRSWLPWSRQPEVQSQGWRVAADLFAAQRVAQQVAMALVVRDHSRGLGSTEGCQVFVGSSPALLTTARS